MHSVESDVIVVLCWSIYLVVGGWTSSNTIRRLTSGAQCRIRCYCCVMLECISSSWWLDIKQHKEGWQAVHSVESDVIVVLCWSIYLVVGDWTSSNTIRRLTSGAQCRIRCYCCVMLEYISSSWWLDIKQHKEGWQAVHSVESDVIVVLCWSIYLVVGGWTSSNTIRRLTSGAQCRIRCYCCVMLEYISSSWWLDIKQHKEGWQAVHSVESDVIVVLCWSIYLVVGGCTSSNTIRRLTSGARCRIRCYCCVMLEYISSSWWLDIKQHKEGWQAVHSVESDVIVVLMWGVFSSVWAILCCRSGWGLYLSLCCDNCMWWVHLWFSCDLLVQLMLVTWPRVLRFRLWLAHDFISLCFHFACTKLFI